MSGLDFLEANFGMSDSEKSQFDAPQQQQQQAPQQQQYQNNNNGGGNNYNKGNYNNNGGQQKSWNNNGGGNSWGNKKDFDKEAWIKKQNEIQDPYLPIAIYADFRNHPPEVIENFVKLADKLLALGYTIRISVDDNSLLQKLNALGSNKLEAVIPFDSFNDMKSRFSRNTKTAENIAEINNPMWEKLPNVVKILLTRNIRLLFGEKNNSNAKALIVWSPDGATKAHEVSQNTGKGNTAWMIKMASKYHFPVININNEASMEKLKEFLKGMNNE